MLAIIGLIAAYSIAAKPQGKLPKNGVIPDEATAVGVALVIFKPIYPQEEVDLFLPYHAQLKDGAWTVYGTLKSGSKGGTPQLQIRKEDGKVLDVWHSM